MSENTPTTDEVRDRYAHDEWDIEAEVEEGPRRAAFDRWLAAHDAEVRTMTLAEDRPVEAHPGPVAEPRAERQLPPVPASAYARGTFYVTGDLSVWEAVWDGRDKCPIWVFVKKLARGGDGAQLVMSEPSAVAT